MKIRNAEILKPFDRSSNDNCQTIQHRISICQRTKKERRANSLWDYLRIRGISLSLSLSLSSAREDILVVQVSDQRRLFRHRMPPSVYFLSTCTGVGHNRKSWVERWTPMFTGADRHLWKQHGAPLGQLVQWICAPLVRAALCLSYAPR